MLDIRWMMCLLLPFVCFFGLSFATDILSTNGASNMISSVTMTVSPSPSSNDTEAEEEETEESFVQANLGLIIGVPTGLGISILGFIGCFIYCGINAAYHSYRDNRDNRQPTGSVDYTNGTATTGVRSNMYTSTGAQNSSAYHSSAFEPSAETMPRHGVENPTPEHTSTV